MKLKIKATLSAENINKKQEIASHLIEALYQRPVNFSIIDILFKRLEIEQRHDNSWKWLVGDQDEATHLKNDVINALRHIIDTGDQDYRYDLYGLYQAYKESIKLRDAKKAKKVIDN